MEDRKIRVHVDITLDEVVLCNRPLSNDELARATEHELVQILKAGDDTPFVSDSTLSVHATVVDA